MPAIRSPSNGSRATSDQKRIRNGPSGSGERCASLANRRAGPGAKTAPLRAASRCAQRISRAGASGRLPGETTFWEARRKNSERTR